MIDVTDTEEALAVEEAVKEGSTEETATEEMTEGTTEMTGWVTEGDLMKDSIEIMITPKKGAILAETTVAMTEETKTRADPSKGSKDLKRNSSTEVAKAAILVLEINL